MKILLRDVVKRFGAVTAVDRTTVEVSDGELFTLLGRRAAARRPSCA